MSTQRTRYFLASVILAVLLTGGLVLIVQSQAASQDIARSPGGQDSQTELAAPLGIPAGYKIGQWPSVPVTMSVLPAKSEALVRDISVSIVGDWIAQITFTTAISTPAAKVYYGVYEPDPLLPWARYLGVAYEVLPQGVSSATQHTLLFDLHYLFRADVNNMMAQGGGLVAYRIEVYQTEWLSSLSDDYLYSTRFYDGRFEFHGDQQLPAVVEGPFVDQVGENSAIVSWDTDLASDGIVRVEGVGDFYAPNSDDTHFEVALTGLAAGSTYTYSIRVTDGVSTTATREYFFRTPAQDSAQFTFAVMGDSRASAGGGEFSFNGVNARVMRTLATHAFNHEAEFIVHTADMINGASTDVTDFEMQLRSFKDSVENVGHYIPIYELMGNHEALVDIYSNPFTNCHQVAIPLIADKEGDQSAEVIFANEFVNPTNGPGPDNVAANVPPGKSLPPYQENVYYFDYGNSRFVVMNNNYWWSILPEQYGGNLEGYVLDDQMAWLTEVFSQTKTDDSIEHVFLFGQEPLFPVAGHSRDAMWYSGGDPDINCWDRTYVIERRDEIWRAFLDTGKAVAGNFGDEHNYSRTYITQDKDGNDFAYPIWQIISGGAGAPFSMLETPEYLAAFGLPPLPWADNVTKFTTQMNYTLFRVNGQEVRLEVYNVDDRLIESVLLKTAAGTVIVPDAPQVEPLEPAAPRLASNVVATQPAATPNQYDFEPVLLGVQAAYNTGQWPSVPITMSLLPAKSEALVRDISVSIVGDWLAQITFTTAISTPAAKVYYGVYEPDPLLPWARYLGVAYEVLPQGVSNTTQHSLVFDLRYLFRADVNNMMAQGGGLVAYRIEVYQTEWLSSLSDDYLYSTRSYDGRFEFHGDQQLPTVIEGPFVDQVGENSAIISWDTDLPVDGLVRVEGVGDFAASNSNDTHFEVALTGLAAGSTYTYAVRLDDGGTSELSTRQYFFRTPAQDSAQFTFAVMGDSRASAGGGEFSFNGVNARVMGTLATRAFNQEAEFIVHTGDMINGASTDVTDFEMQLESFKDSVERVGHYIPIYELMGNHEVLVDIYSPSFTNCHQVAVPLIIDKEGDQSAEVIFANEFVNPTNGPEPDNVAANVPPGKSLPPYQESVYYFDYGNSRFVVMNNNYWWSILPEQYGGNLEGYVLDDQMTWLTQVFSQTKTDDSIEHVFLFAQEPLFPVAGHSKDAMWYHGGDPDINCWDRTYVIERRDEIWRAFLDTGKAVAGNFGDEHNYSRTLITQDKDGNDFAYPVWQIISGGAGAPFSMLETPEYLAAFGLPPLPWFDNVMKFSTQMHYTLFRVDGSRVMLEVYNIDGHLIDSQELTEDLGGQHNLYLPVIMLASDG